MNATQSALISALQIARTSCDPRLEEIAALIDSQPLSGITVSCRNSSAYWTEYASTAAKALAVASNAGEGYEDYTDVSFDLFQVQSVVKVG